ncbi:mandelate racemase/muconate lactonizing enzyme family protein [Pseudoruegeria sp. SHC-113]|uniref:mandelate racemase/muconate lactonizing enzyme family protein n=1 Tax=Pseudoruegeria sp. SHC-113 TaxID=2855439 RepID=UPI0021BB7BC4|nr:mandelate racemase/muconate lactonizing enzyme family protein [Pseudoruegeria sp. SHC-113]MCT8161713.1 mandelate racemase/muconate lactonizing enzyme family protein [Pseudoruegeria sp. SHC-113]
MNTPLRPSEQATPATRRTAGHRISAIRPFIVWVGARNQLIVKVETESGLYGWGESGLSGREKAVVGALSHFEPLLQGQDAMQIGAIWQRVYRSQYFEGGRVLQAALSAIDIALHDIKAKAFQVPVYELLGGAQRREVPTFVSVAAGAFDQAREQARELYDRGWRCIRLFPDMRDCEVFEPREEIGKAARLCREVRADLGEDVMLGIDWHHRLSVAEAASFCQRLPKGTLDFIEEPIRDETPEAYESLRGLTDIPFAIGEEFASKWQFLPYIERGIHQFNRVDVCNVGGLTEAMKVAAMSEAHYVDVMPHNPLGPICTAASIHFGVAVPNFAALEVNVMSDALYGAAADDALFLTRPRLAGTVFKQPEGVGLGIEIDESLLASVPGRDWGPPMLVRRDGSVTNW